eukprot:TRINITY_DN11995_c0_g1_i1.p1 TRINITY_DN11995_c0_g1~~TRINITY_DN11995_c0_g1_i1.p1  ORF type:complete len:142 (-),score=4.60 TRINITY_DN11995_c0_g1_i1:2-427(-)
MRYNQQKNTSLIYAVARSLSRKKSEKSRGRPSKAETKSEIFFCPSCHESLRAVLHDPLNTNLKAVAGLRTAALNLPLAITALNELQNLGDHSGVLRGSKVLLVGKDKNRNAGNAIDDVHEGGVGLLQTALVTHVLCVDTTA